MKKRMFKTAIWLLVAISILLSMLPAGSIPAKAEEEAQSSLPTIEEQIRAYADSIDQNDAVSTAASTLALHGITMGGKTLKLDENDALTAVLLNSEMMQIAMTKTCAAAIDYMQMLDMPALPYVHFANGWNGNNSFFYAYVQNAPGVQFENRDLRLIPQVGYSQNRNSYDEALDWMVGDAAANLSFQPEMISEDAVTYEVSFIISDYFDFETGTGEGFQDLISGIGAIMFREFTWEATVSFDIIVPYACTHTSGKYHWTYDAENIIMVSDSNDGYIKNEMIRYSFELPDGQTQLYFQLDETVRLRHDKPWVLEYQICNPGYFVFAPLQTTDSLRPYLRNYGRDSVFVTKNQRIKFSDDETQQLGLANPHQRRTHYYGSAMKSMFDYSTKQIYTIRLENVLGNDGTNMIWLTVYNNDLQETVLYVPMDDYYVSETWGEKDVLHDTESVGVSGLDILINFIGNDNLRFRADYFELRIWENGIDGENEDYFEETVVPPTCTEDGYTAHTCSACGYSYNTDYVPSYGHSFGDWYVETAATCVQHGTEARDCVTCNAHETRVLPTTDHVYVPAVTAPTCTEQGYTTHICACGDSYIDSYVDATGHSFALTEQVDPTCTLDGYAVYSCQCGEERKETLPSTGHGEREIRGARKATCTEDGYSGDRHCSDCGKKIATGRVLPATGHNYVDGECRNCGAAEIGAGDVNGDGVVNYLDAMLIAQYYVGDIGEEDLNLSAADVNGDGTVNYLDAMMIAQYYVGDIDDLP